MSNIRAENADGVHELLVIGTALKQAKAYIEERGDSSADVDEALAIIDKITDDGFASV
ncbi:hypothetical protein [Cellvibrio sp. OA-2007]|uniref:hypothetical protein n=1 Tax=Cellvibrio sp. OA-2007 TaxID=529823 RepID=UPI000AB1F00D|nr:hypothetical protein [Cellvibrio sp. OA-2007]